MVDLKLLFVWVVDLDIMKLQILKGLYNYMGIHQLELTLWLIISSRLINTYSNCQPFYDLNTLYLDENMINQFILLKYKLWII